MSPLGQLPHAQQPALSKAAVRASSAPGRTLHEGTGSRYRSTWAVSIGRQAPGSGGVYLDGSSGLSRALLSPSSRMTMKNMGEGFVFWRLWGPASLPCQDTKHCL